MLNLFSILILFCFCSVEVLSVDANSETPGKVIYQLDDIDKLFEEFTKKYNKKYNSDEHDRRRNAFVQNLININRWNREQTDVVYKINPFTDLTFEEFAATYTGVRGNLTNDNLIPYKPKGMAPDSLDWRQSNLVTEVKDQRRCGSCYIFSALELPLISSHTEPTYNAQEEPFLTTDREIVPGNRRVILAVLMHDGNIEGQYAKQHGQLISLSEQQSLDCNSNGCSGGYPHDVMQALVNSGCMKQSDYPYEGQQGQCRTDENKIVVKVTGGSQLSIASEDDLKDAVANYGPLSIVLHINEQWKTHPGGILNPRSCGDKDLHAVLLVGYGTDGGVPYWLIKNSWGQGWSEGGYLRLIRGKAACSIGMYAASATVA